MQCRDARELLDSFLAEELLVETNHEVLRHLSGCPDCTADLEGRARIRSRLKQAFARAADLQMRPGLRDEMSARLRTSALSKPRWWQSGWLMAAAASMVMAVAAGVYFLRPSVPNLAAQAAGDHQNCAVKFALRERPIPLAEAARYDAAYARLQTSPPDLVPTGAGALHVAERHSCVFENRRFGHVVFLLDHHLVSLLMTRDDSTGRASRDAALPLFSRVNGLSIASYDTPGHVVYIVSDLQGPAFRQVAQSLAESRVAALAEWFAVPRVDGDVVTAWRRPHQVQRAR